ncbi:hypothetical protein L596_000070 [Steinernema carpocapsae]|uniref:Uncharacterized protein n=1 Tax=Steinernema carpocapsae TaxID=34508 RepID=A0A4U8UJH3_STECR|nr:hypothetical protein L596_000070 [Steinernema carpocapsae]
MRSFEILGFTMMKVPLHMGFLPLGLDPYCEMPFSGTTLQRRRSSWTRTLSLRLDVVVVFRALPSFCIYGQK